MELVEPRLIKVHLTGVLGDNFGHDHEYWIYNPAQAVRAIAANHPDFVEWVYESEKRGIYYEVVIDDEMGIGVDEFDRPIASSITISPVVEGSGKFGKIILGLGLLGASFFMPGSITLFGALISSTAIGALGISLALGGIFSALSPVPKLAKSDTKRKREPKRVESSIFNDAVDSGDQGLPIPVGYGRYMILNPIPISQGINVNRVPIKPADKRSDDGDDDDVSALPEEAPNTLQSIGYREVLFLLCEGKIKGPTTGNIFKDVYLDGTPIKSLAGKVNIRRTTVDFRDGTGDQSYIPHFGDIEKNIPVGLEVKYQNPVVRTITDSNVNRIRLLMMVPSLQKVIEIKKKNVVTSRTVATFVTFRVEVSVNGGGFTLLFEKKISGKTTSPFERDYEFLIPAGTTRSLRVTRLITNSTSNLLSNDLYWQSFTEVIDVKLSYPWCSLLALTMRSDVFPTMPAIAIHLDLLEVETPHNYNGLTRAYSGNFNGSLTRQWTNNPVWCLRDMIVNDRYGAGRWINPSLVDPFNLYPLAQYCDQLVPDGKGGLEPRFTMNCVIDSRDTAIKVLEEMASVFRGMLYYSNGGIVVTQDKPRTPLRLFNEANTIQEIDESTGEITKDNFEYSGTSIESRHSIAIVYWNDPADFYKRKPEYIIDKESFARYGYNVLEVKAVGCTSKQQARRLGLWMLLSEKNITQTCIHNVGVEGELVSPGDAYKVANPLHMVERLGGRINSCTTDFFILDEAIAFIPGKIYTLSVYNSAGDMVSRVINNPGTTTNSVTATSSFGFTAVWGSVWILEHNTLNAELFSCISATEMEENEFEITGVEYNASIYDAVDFGSPVVELPISALPNLTIPPDPPQTLTISEGLYASNGAAGIKTRVDLTFLPSLSPLITNYEVEVRYPSDDNFNLLQVSKDTNAVLMDADPGTYTFRVRSVNALGRYSDYQIASKEVFGLTLPPSDVTSFSINPVNGTAFLRWDISPDLDVLVGGSFIIKHSPKITGVNWSDGTIITKISGSTNFYNAPLLNGTYQIKALDSINNESINPTKIILINAPELAAYDVVINDVQQPSFPGTYTGTVRTFIGGNWVVHLQTLDLFDQALGLFDDALGLFDDLNVGLNTQVTSTGIYEFPLLDLTDVYTSRITANMESVAVDESQLFELKGGEFDFVAGSFDGDGTLDANASLQVSTSEDGITYTNWNDFIIGNYVARYIKRRVKFDSYNVNHNVQVKTLEVSIDVPERIESGSFTTFPAADKIINYEFPFRSLPIVSLSANNLASGEYVKIVYELYNQFAVSVYDTTNSRVVRTVNWLAKGYGKVS